MTEPQLALPDRVGVVNVGLSLFADAIREQGAPVISVDWRVPAGGQPDAVAALGRLYGDPRRADRGRQRRGAAPPRRGHAAAHRRHHGGGRRARPGGPDAAALRARHRLRRRPRPAAALDAGRGRGRGLGGQPRAGRRLAGRRRDRARPGQRARGRGADGHRARARRPAVRGGEPGRRHRRRTRRSTQGPGEVAWFGVASRRLGRPAGLPARRGRPGDRPHPGRGPARWTCSRWPRRRSRWATTSTSAPRPRPTC